MIMHVDSFTVVCYLWNIPCDNSNALNFYSEIKEKSFLLYNDYNPPYNLFFFRKALANDLTNHNFLHHDNCTIFKRQTSGMLEG